jgi:hypothetical protein
MKLRRALTLMVMTGLALTAELSWGQLGIAWDYAMMRLHRPYTVEDRLAQFGDAARQRLAPYFASAGVAFPPESVTMLAFKDSGTLELYARGFGQSWTFVRAYPVLAASGELGPKLREGDKQVPEGLYRVISLNANSKFHVSLRLDYPNAFDLRVARAEGRTRLGGDIMIHGKDVSAGCLAMGDEVAEELFTLAAMVMPGAVGVIISPTDLRAAAWGPVPISAAGWTPDLYRAIQAELANYPPPAEISSVSAVADR